MTKALETLKISSATEDAIRVLLAASEPPTDEEIAAVLAKHWHGEHCEDFDVDYAKFRMLHGDAFDNAANVRFVIRYFFGPVKP